MYETINKPWGYYKVLDSQEGFQIKKIFVNPQSKLSLQSHEHRAENWIVAFGIATVQIDSKKITMESGNSIFVPKMSKHRLENNTNNDLMIIEIQIGDYLGEDDISMKNSSKLNKPSLFKSPL